MRKITTAMILTLLIASPQLVSAQAKEKENRAVILLIDKSGSMQQEKRIQYAKEAAKIVAQRLDDADHVGVIGFDDTPLMVVYLESVGRVRHLIDQQIDRIKPGGQTDFLPALQEAKRQLEKVTTGSKQIILMSDGVTRGSQAQLVDLISNMKNDSKITVSTIAIGKEADLRVMKRIAQYGGGFFQIVCNPSMMPTIVANLVFKDSALPQSEDDAQKCPDVSK